MSKRQRRWKYVLGGHNSLSFLYITTSVFLLSTVLHYQLSCRVCGIQARHEDGHVIPVGHPPIGQTDISGRAEAASEGQAWPAEKDWYEET